MIKQLLLKFGPWPQREKATIADPLVTVFVGPNNSGKSLVLRELQEYLTEGPSEDLFIVDRITIEFPESEELENTLSPFLTPRSAEIDSDGFLEVMRRDPSNRPFSEKIYIPEIRRVAKESRSQIDLAKIKDSRTFFTQYLSLFVLGLDGKTRLTLTEARDAGDLQKPAKNHLADLFRNDAARERVRDILFEAFGLYFVIDPTKLGSFRIRMSKRPPDDRYEEQAVDARATRFQSEATEISQMSDGVKAFTGIISALISSVHRFITIDEPEAFLYPPLARKLGLTITSLAKERKLQVFASTHSPQFLMGCVDAGANVNIVRLTYEGGKGTACSLRSDELKELMLDPLLRSTGVLNALFYRGVVVCEADGDRAFYEEINARILAETSGGAPDSLFLNAQNKQTIHRMIKPLRTMGIPAAAIVDFDIFKDSDLTTLLKACVVPRAIIQSITALRTSIERRFEESNVRMESGGIDNLKGEDRESCGKLLSDLKVYGIFVVPGGALESWVPELGSKVSKHKWVQTVFQKMGADPLVADYVQPSNEDVWAFIREIAKWLKDPSRRGMSSV
jgi:ABC-type cobalamin/Fe3+-siderophores transport system ATPase subunit